MDTLLSLLLSIYFVIFKTFEFSRACSKIVEENDAKCSNLTLKLKKSYPDSFNLRVYVTTDDCTLPDLKNLDSTLGFELVKKANKLESRGVNEVNFDEFSLENLCGLVNLVTVMADSSSNSYIEHSVTPFFINCSSIDYGIEVLSQNGTLETLTAGIDNPFKQSEFKINFQGKRKCNTQVSVPNTCTCARYSILTKFPLCSLLLQGGDLKMSSYF